jgi:glycosyltransferase involved in cell wall biosynthesis
VSVPALRAKTTEAPADAPGAQRVGYVLSLFPSYDETFILREMKGIADRGVRLSVFSLRQRHDPIVQDDAKPFLPRTRYAAFLFSGEVLGAVLRTLVRRPFALAAILLLIARGCWRRPATLLKSLALVPKSLLFAELAAADGLERIHAHWATYPATAALLMSRLTGIPWSFTCHAHDIFLDPSLLVEKLERADFALTCTGDNKRYLETLTPVAKAKVRVCYHGLDLSLFEPVSGRSPASALRILSVGSLLECKGFDILIRACAILKRQGVAVRATIAGGGPEEASLRAAAEREGVAAEVRFTGYLTQAQLVPLYQEAELFVLPAVLEMHWGIPNVLVEAMACGVPVVTTALPSIPELVQDGVHGLIARNRDPEDLAAKVASLASDAERRKGMGAAARLQVERRFDLQRNIEIVLDALLAERRPPAAPSPLASMP